MNYSSREMMAVALARLIEDGKAYIVGTGLPLVGAALAKNTHAPNARLIFESGLFEEKTARIVKMISPYVKEDPSAFCSYEDFLQGVSTLSTFCALRAESIRGQLDGTLPSTIREQLEFSGDYVDAKDVWLPDMGEIADLAD